MGTCQDAARACFARLHSLGRQRMAGTGCTERARRRIVFRARHRGTGDVVALKSIKMEAEKDGFPVAALREIRALQRLQHDHIIPLLTVVARQDMVYLVLEYMEHDLSGILSEPSLVLEEDQLKTYMQQLLQALACMHRYNYVHRDLKG